MGHNMTLGDIDDAEYYSRKDVANIFGVSVHTVDSEIKSGKLKVARVGTLIKIKGENILKYAAAIEEG